MVIDAKPQDTAEQELSIFSYIVSHDLSASFRHVSQFSALIIRDLEGEASERVRDHGAQLQHATEKCQQMMDQLLTFSRVQQRPLDYTRCNAMRLVEVATLQLSAEVAASGAEISIDQLGEPVGDAELMTMAFKQALSNAIKFRPSDQAPRISVRGAQTKDAILIRIVDDGIGVVLDRQEKMFRMFYQDHGEGAYPGIGAGLAICRRILRRHGGDAYFTDVDTGACLELRFPIIAGFDPPAAGDAV